ncbi:hypothetical protein PT2222_210001 [Paraburkholderia tropica]
MRHDFRCRYGEVRSAGDQARRDSGRGRDAASTARGIEGESDGSMFDGAHDGCGGSGACGTRVARDCGGRSAQRSDCGCDHDLRILATRGDDGQGGGEPRLRDDVGRRRALRASALPFAVCDGRSEGGDGGVRGEAQTRVQEQVRVGGKQFGAPVWRPIGSGGGIIFRHPLRLASVGAKIRPLRCTQQATRRSEARDETSGFAGSTSF